MSDFPITIEDVKAAGLRQPDRSLRARGLCPGPAEALCTVYVRLTPAWLALGQLVDDEGQPISGPEPTLNGHLKVVANSLRVDGRKTHLSYSVVPTPEPQRAEIARRYRDEIMAEARRAHFLWVCREIAEAEGLERHRQRKRRHRANQALAPDYDPSAVETYFAAHSAAVAAAAPARRLHELVRRLG